jgi:hypothetical protein
MFFSSRLFTDSTGTLNMGEAANADKIEIKEVSKTNSLVFFIIKSF